MRHCRSGSDVQIFRIWLAGVLEGDRAVRLGVHELVDGGILRVAHLVHGALRGHYAVVDEIQVVDDLERGHQVVGHHDRGRAERIVQRAYQVGDGVERDRVESGERLVVNDQRGIGRDRPRQRPRRSMPPDRSPGIRQLKGTGVDLF